MMPCAAGARAGQCTLAWIAAFGELGTGISHSSAAVEWLKKTPGAAVAA